MREGKRAGKELRLIDVPDSQIHVFDLAVVVAEASGDEILIAEWRSRRSALEVVH
ncbi:MAG: hypothetical protein ACR2LJ_11780 [Acidimicrobiales bacterium]